AGASGGIGGGTLRGSVLVPGYPWQVAEHEEQGHVATVGQDYCERIGETAYPRCLYRLWPSFRAQAAGPARAGAYSRLPPRSRGGPRKPDRPPGQATFRP